MADDLMKKLLETTKNETLFLSPIKRMLLTRPEFDADRAWDVIHPSELSYDDLCPRSVYYRLAGWEIPSEANFFQLEVIFSQGHGYHDKYQQWAWEVGLQASPPWGLRGTFQCLACRYRWEATSPVRCPKCRAGLGRLKYREVGVSMPSHNIAGRADGDIDLGKRVPLREHPLLEVKSVGEGTIRKAAPQTVSRYTKKIRVAGEDEDRSWTDWQAVWRSIKRPFKNHLKQGAIYGAAAGRDTMVYVYEFKPTGATKDFLVRHDFGIIEEELDTALDVMYAVKKGKPPKCPHGGCAKCRAFEELRHGARDEEDDDPTLGAEDEGAAEGSGEAEEEGAEPTSEARGGDPGGPARPRRPLRRRPHGGSSRAQRVGQPPRSGTRRRGDR